MNEVPVPSLMMVGPRGESRHGLVEVAAMMSKSRGLLELFHPGFYMVFLLRNGHEAADAVDFRHHVCQLLSSIELNAGELRIPSNDLAEARFAFCALLDEVILNSTLPIRADWECRPLQLELFGEHMAGERFFDRLELLRREGVARLGVLEVFHLCLLLGFQGRYAFDGREKLDYLTARLGDEIAHLQGRPTAFAPHWAAPDRVAHKLRGELPLWTMALVFGGLALAAFVTLRVHLKHSTAQGLAPYGDVIRLAPRAAHIMITWP
jgi:type VI secretion system protein ImpK